MDYRKLLSLLSREGSELAPVAGRQVDNLAEEALPAIRKSTIPMEVGPEVLGKGTSRVTPDVSDIIDADLVSPKVSTMDAVKEFARNNKGKIAGGLTVAELARQMMSGGGQENPSFDPMEAKTQIEEAPKMEQETNAPVKISPVRRDLGVDAAEKVEAAIPSEETPEDNSMSREEEMMLNAQGADSQSQFMNALVRSGIMAGSAIANSKADYSGVDALDKTNGQNVANVKGLMGAKAENQRAKKAQDELGDEAKLRDINSSISKTARELAQKLGINVDDKISAKQLQDAGLPLGTLLSTQMAAEGRKEAAQLAREAQNGQKNETNKLKVQGSVDRQVSQLLKSKDMESYNAAKDAIFALDSAMESDDDKIKGGAAFMQYAKIAQGDNSVVRDGDMAQLAGKYNYTSVSDMFNKLKAQAAGGNFGSKELAAMKEVAQKTQEIKGRRVKELMSPIIKRTAAAGLDIHESLDPAVVKEFGPDDNSGKSEELTTPKASRTFKTAQQPGSVVTVKSGKKYRIEADGVTGTEI